jgi:hypothetical protein
VENQFYGGNLIYAFWMARVAKMRWFVACKPFIIFSNFI